MITYVKKMHISGARDGRTERGSEKWWFSWFSLGTNFRLGDLNWVEYTHFEGGSIFLIGLIPLDYVYMILPLSFSKKKSLFIYLWEREWAQVREGRRERERETIPSRLPAVSAQPNAGLDPTTLRSWPEQKSRVGCLTNWVTQVPLHDFLFI